MNKLCLVMCIPCFLYLLMRDGLQLLLGDQSVGESGVMDNIVNPQCTCMRVTVVVSFCVCVCLRSICSF